MPYFNMRFLLLITTFVLSACPCAIFAQSVNLDEPLHPPVDFPMRLSGNFGELRSNHFHAGIDIKTAGAEGKQVHAIADGYVSRIKVSANGYGHALYIDHPDQGLTSVYGHLQAFNQQVHQYVREQQYKKETFEIQLFPEDKQFQVQKGEVIGLSGNTGSSKGPHLHFEIRDLTRQEPLNPLHFNLDIPDRIPPKIFNVAIYPLGPKASVNGEGHKQILDVVARGKGRYKLMGQETPRLHGRIGFALRSFDFLDSTPNWCGLYAVKLYVDSTLMYHHQMDRFSFYETRYINSLIDYEEKIRNNQSFQKSFREPNNQLGIYEYLRNSGIYDFQNDTLHNILYRITDTYGNTSEVTFQVRSRKQPPKKLNQSDTTTPQDTLTAVPMAFDQANSFRRSDIRLDFPSHAFYDTIYFEYHKQDMADATKPFYSDLHQVHNRYTPVNKNFSLSIHPHGLPDMLKDKTFIARVDEEDESYEYTGGEFINGFISTNVRSFGKYVVMVDRKPPQIKPFIINKRKISFKIEDELSGINSYNGYINGRWVLFEYDPKNDLLIYRIDPERLPKASSYELELYVSDALNNVATYYDVIQPDEEPSEEH